MNKKDSAQQANWLLTTLAFTFVSTIAVAQDVPLQQPRQADGAGSIVIDGELKQWHKVTLTLDGAIRARTRQYAESVRELRNECHVHARIRITVVHRARLFRGGWQRGGIVGQKRNEVAGSCVA